MATKSHTKRAKRLKPTGHSAAIESMIQPAIVVGSTLMSAIAAYVLALDEITRILDRRGAPSDYFIVALCTGMGFLIDMAIIVSATRYKMHAIRSDPREAQWLTLAKWVLTIGLASETMTLFYFFVHLSAQAFPTPLVNVADTIHAILAVVRAFLPPVVIAYFAAGVLPVMFDRADRNREIKSRTSANIMMLIDSLSEVYATDNKSEMLRALGGQLMLDTYATYDETGRTSEDGQLQRDAKLLTHLARIHRLDWGEIAADVAPELRASEPPVTQVYEHPDVTRTNTPTDEATGDDDKGNEPPENDPTPPRGKRGARPGGNGREVNRSYVRGTSPNEAAPAASTAIDTSTPGVTNVFPKTRGKPKPRNANAGRSQEDTEALTAARLAAGKTILRQDPHVSVRPFAKRVAMMTHYHINESTAQDILVELRGRKTKSKSAQAADNAAQANR